jgi:methionyl-tRNA synthetase
VDLRTLAWGQLQLGTKLGQVEAVFPRADKTTIERMQQMEQQRSVEGATAEGDTKAATSNVQLAGVGASPKQPATQAVTGASTADNKITIDDFAKVEMRVGEVKVAEKVKGADKLLRMEIDIGTEVRQIVAGIAKAYEPEQLLGRKVVIVTNLQPRKLRGLESNGMIVAASIGDDGQPVLAGFLEDVPIGAKLR